MTRASGSRKLLSQSLLWISLPLGLLLSAAITTGTLAYQRVVTSLLIDRDRQLAALSASQVGQALASFAQALETEVESGGLAEAAAHQPGIGPEAASEVLRGFPGGIAITDSAGELLSSRPALWRPSADPVSQLALFAALQSSHAPAFSDVLIDPASGEQMILMGIGIRDDAGRFAGAALVGVSLADLPLGDSIRRLSESDEEFAYLVDGHGRAIFHPVSELIGQDLSDRPVVSRVTAGESGGMLWTSPSGQRLVQGYAPVPGTGWGLVVREPWEVVVQPVRAYSIGLGLTALTVLSTSGALLLLGVRKITRPITHLADQAHRLATGRHFRPPVDSGVEEIERLSHAFGQMAEQVESYRTGLRRYLGSITASQEEERKRIARELHDETIQSLLAMQRALELYQTREDDPQKLQALLRLREMLDEASRGVREISHDLRPMILEDLGLVPALRTLLQPRSDESSPRARLEVHGPAGQLSSEQELALYRIAQEALTNVRKHARASAVHVSLRFHPDRIELAIQDNGVGFQPPPSVAQLAQQGSFGLMGIQERVQAIGGDLDIRATPGQGTRVLVSVPQQDGAGGESGSV